LPDLIPHDIPREKNDPISSNPPARCSISDTQGVVGEKTNFFSTAQGNAVHCSSDKNALELNNLILLRSIQQSILNKAGRNINCDISQIDPSKNLKNFFIQSSLTFNGDPMNTQ
jgi:hypothetical protein